MNRLSVVPAFLAALVVCLPASRSAAQSAPAYGVNMTWDHCAPEGGTTLKLWACDANVSGAVAGAVVSFKLQNPMADFVGIESAVHLESSSPYLPDWWQFFNAGSCRGSAISASADFINFPNVACLDPWSGHASGGLSAYQTAYTTPTVPGAQPNQARIMVALALADPVPLAAGQEYYGFSLRIRGTNTVGAGSCAGCDVPVCLVVSYVKAVAASGSYEWLQAPMLNNLVSWQCGTGTALAECVIHGCTTYSWWVSSCSPGCATPARNRTWGALKAHYR